MLLLSACSHDHRDLVRYLNHIKARPAESLITIPSWTLLADYQVSKHLHRRDPFSLSPYQEKHRYQGALTAYALSELQFVGTVAQDTKIWALIHTPKNRVMPITVGQFIGSEGNEVLEIKRDALILRHPNRGVHSFRIQGA